MKTGYFRLHRWRWTTALLLTLVGLALLPGVRIRRAAAQSDPAVVGQWSAVMSWPLIGIHAHLLPTGTVLLWPRSDAPRLWDPATNALSSVPGAGFNVFCSGHAFLADGRLLVAGGHISNGWGYPYASLYDPLTGAWTSLPKSLSR